MKRADLETISGALRSDILTLLGRYGLSDADREDLAHDAVVKLWLMRHAINDAQHAKALAFRIAKHLALNEMKRRRTLGMDIVANVRQEGCETDSRLICDENELWLQRQMEHLPPRERQILVLRQVEQFTTEEIASLLGVKKETVITELARARKKLMTWRKG